MSGATPTPEPSGPGPTRPEPQRSEPDELLLDLRPPVPPLPRELVLASAGTGKTFRISSRIIGLLELGAGADEIFASTFTRKAAGEILERVLARLARAGLDDPTAEELARHALLREGGPVAGTERWQALLVRLVDGLHRVNVGTLDAFFVRVAGSFALELGLPLGWTIGDEPTSARLESEAMEDVLGSARQEEILELVRALLGGDATRSVHERVLDRARDLRWLLHQVDPDAEAAWDSLGADGEPPPSAEERRAAADRIDALDPPANRDGSPNKPWTRALGDGARALREGDWDTLLEKGIGCKVLAGATEFNGRPIAPDAERAFQEALQLAGRAIREEHARRSRALGALAERFDRALALRQRRQGAYRFHDVTRMVGGEDPLAGRSDLWYRLDQRARHLLLDEFQDTSLPQWEALRPLAEELLSGHAGERAAVVVADPKQSIYGWRGAEPELVHRVGRDFPLQEDRLRRSYRSSGRVLDFVNRLFHELDRRPIWGEDPEDRALVRAWLEDFEPHEAAWELPGHVRVEVGPAEESMASDDRPRMMRRAAECVAEIRRRAPGHSVGVLLRKNRNVPVLIAELRSRGIEASEEGGTRLTDSPAVAAVLALLRMADHPGDTIARYHVCCGPLGPLVDLSAHGDDRAARKVSDAVRSRILQDGYGSTLDRWTRELGRSGAPDRRDLRRLFQLVELGFRWDARGATLRPRDFVRFVESEKVEDPAAAGVRVMTVHQAKGLEFDAVVLPELDLDLTGRGPGAPAALPERDPATGRILRIFPYVKSAARPLLPEAAPALLQARAAALRDALGILYVATTRARFSLHLLVAADSKRGPSKKATFARIVREAIGAHDRPVTEGEILLDEGDAGWADRIGEPEGPAPAGVGAREPAALEVHLAEGRRDRMLTRTAPSTMTGSAEVRLSALLSLDTDGRRARARRLGVVVHEWCRCIGWIEDGIPSDATLLDRGRRAALELSEGELRNLLSDFHEWLEAPSVRGALSRAGAPGGSRLERERSFAVRLGDEIIEGAIDRLVLVPDGKGGWTRARIIDFKTDGEVDAGPYRFQLDAYRRGVGRLYGLESDRIDARLVFLTAGEVVEL